MALIVVRIKRGKIFYFCKKSKKTHKEKHLCRCNTLKYPRTTIILKILMI